MQGITETKDCMDGGVRRQMIRMHVYALINEYFNLFLRRGKIKGRSHTLVVGWRVLGKSRDFQDFQRRRNCRTMNTANSIFLLLFISTLHWSFLRHTYLPFGTLPSPSRTGHHLLSSPHPALLPLSFDAGHPTQQLSSCLPSQVSSASRRCPHRPTLLMSSSTQP